MEATAIFHFHSFMILFDLHAKLHQDKVDFTGAESKITTSEKYGRNKV